MKKALVWNNKNWCSCGESSVHQSIVPFHTSVFCQGLEAVSVLCAVLSTSVGFVRLSPVTGLSDHCLSHDSLAVIQVDAFKNEQYYSNPCSTQLIWNKWPSKVMQADIMKSEKFLNASYHSYEDSALKAYSCSLTY